MQTMSQRFWVFFSVCLVGALVPLDLTIVNTCLGPIQSDLHMSLQALQWVVSGFGIAFTALLTTAGRFADILGRRRVLSLGVIGFGLASLGAGLAENSAMLILMRVLQGFFGAVFFPAGTAVISDVYPKDKHAKILGLYAALSAAGFVLGPMLGSLMVSVASWRWIFLMNLPVIVFSLLIGMRVWKESKHPDSLSLDLKGTVWLVSFLSAFVFVVSMGEYHGWTSPLILGMAGWTLVSFMCFCCVEKKATDPIVPFHFFRQAGLQSGAWVYSVAVGFAWVVLFFVGLFLHEAMGFSTAKVGVLFSAMTVTSFIFPAIAGRLFDKFGAYRTVFIVYSNTLLGLLGLSMLFTHSPIWVLCGVFAVYGAAWGMGNGVGTSLAISDLDNSHDVGVVSGVLLTFVNVVGMLALSISTAVFSYLEKKRFLGNLHVFGMQFQNVTQEQLVSAMGHDAAWAKLLSQLPAGQSSMLNTMHQTAFASAFRSVMEGLLIIALVASPIVLITAKRLRMKLDAKVAHV